MDELRDKWNDILLQIKEENDITDISYKTFLEPLEIFSIDGNDLYILFSTDSDKMALNYISKKYEPFLKVAISETTGKEYQLHFILPKDAVNISPKAEEPSNLQTNSENYLQSNLNSKYTFDTFVVGGSNRFAQTASLAVAESPGDIYNPLYIYGGVGLGKTHLMHAIGNYILEEDGSKKVLYVTSEEFLNEVIECIRGQNKDPDSMSRLRGKYRTVDVLMIDDIQLIVGKESTQEEFFHTFNALYAQGKQIILTSDKPPKEIKTLEERIRTRFEMGLMADIGQPDYETRMAIIRRKIEDKNMDLPDEISDYIANNIRSNIREIEGAINKLDAYQKLQNREITMSVAEIELASMISPDKPKEITAQMIIEVVAEHYHISMDQMISSSRSRSIARPRQIAMFLCSEMISTPLDAIGSLLGGRDHSTVIHGRDKIYEEYQHNPETKAEINAIKKLIIPE